MPDDNNDQKQPKELITFAAAWAQLVAALATVDKADLRNLSGAWQELLDIFHFKPLQFWLWDWPRFGGVAVALNVLAVCLLTFPAIYRQDPGGDNDRAFVKTFAILWKAGSYALLFSFVLFVAYLNLLCLAALYLAFAILLVTLLFFRLTGK